MGVLPQVIPAQKTLLGLLPRRGVRTAGVGMIPPHMEACRFPSVMTVQLDQIEHALRQQIIVECLYDLLLSSCPARATSALWTLPPRLLVARSSPWALAPCHTTPRCPACGGAS